MRHQAHFCVAGHALDITTAHETGECDRCYHDIRAGDPILACARCDPIRWICSDCQALAVRKQPEARDETSGATASSLPPGDSRPPSSHGGEGDDSDAGENSDSEGTSTDSDGSSESEAGSDEDKDGAGTVEAASLAEVEAVGDSPQKVANSPISSAYGALPGASGATANAPVMPLPTYGIENLPPKTGITLPMMAVPPEFLRVVPREPELLYNAPEALFDDVIRNEAERISKPALVQNKIVYDSVGPPSFSPGFHSQSPMSPRSGGKRESFTTKELFEDLPSYYTLDGNDDTTLIFESRFESGNLRRAVKIYDFEYDLILNPDYNTKAHTQWYFFSVENTRKEHEYRFNFINMVKPTSVYNEGMRPLMYSATKADMEKIGWHRGGENIIYYQNGLRRKGSTNYYTLTFTVRFEHDHDTVSFAHCYPYSYTDLQHDLQKLESQPDMATKFRRRKLCETLAGNACDLVTITSFCSDPDAIQARRAVVITARVHPGESNASWVMKGVLDYLTGPSLDAKVLRDNFVFKIIPMLNPDGVVVGNYRCSLVGHDLNRQWGEPSRKLHPTIYYTKNMMRHLLDDRAIVLYVDIHGHSRKKNVFMYGNCNNEAGGLREKVFPRLICRSSDCFCFDDCCFKMQKSKESSARVVVFRDLGVTNSFTLEASFCGADFGPLIGEHFTTRHLEEMGYMVCDAILDFCDPDQSKVNLVLKELQVLFPDDGHSDDVSDSDVDEVAIRQARRAATKLLNKQQPKKEKSKGKKNKETKIAAQDANLEDGESEGDGAKGGKKKGKRRKKRKDEKNGRTQPAARTRSAQDSTSAMESNPCSPPLGTPAAPAGAPGYQRSGVPALQRLQGISTKSDLKDG